MSVLKLVGLEIIYEFFFTQQLSHASQNVRFQLTNALISPVLNIVPYLVVSLDAFSFDRGEKINDATRNKRIV